MFISKSIKSYSYKYICKQKIWMGRVFILNYVSMVQWKAAKKTQETSSQIYLLDRVCTKQFEDHLFINRKTFLFSSMGEFLTDLQLI